MGIPGPPIRYQFSSRFFLWEVTVFVLSVLAVAFFFGQLAGGQGASGVQDKGTHDFWKESFRQIDKSVRDLSWFLRESTGRLDARVRALDSLKEASNGGPKHPFADAILSEIRSSIEMTSNIKATSVVVYCMTQYTTCDKILHQVKMELATDPDYSRCLAQIKGNGRDTAELSGLTQMAMLTALIKCQRAVVTFEDLSIITPSEMTTLVNAMSEHGSLTYDGKSVASNKALFLFSMTGKSSNAQMNQTRLRQEVKEEVYARSVTDYDRDGIRELAWSFKRRLDYVYPIIDGSLTLQ